MKITREMMEEAKNLPEGHEMGSFYRYKVMIECIEQLSRLHFWQFKAKRFYKTVLKRASL